MRTCGRLTAARSGLCAGHHRWWLEAGRPELSGWCATTGLVLGDQKTRISLVGVTEQVEVEFLFGVQSAVEQGHKPRPSDLRSVAGQARRANAESLGELDGSALNPASRRFIARTVDALALNAKTPESECLKDVWDLRVWGFKGTFSFVGRPQPNHPGHRPMAPISQDWLRHAAKRWAAVQLPLHRSESSVEAVLSVVARWSAHLARRPDGGEDPTVLGKDDITSFLVGLRAGSTTDNSAPTPTPAPSSSCGGSCAIAEIWRPMSGVARWPDFEAGSSWPPKRSRCSRDENPDDEIGDAVPDAVVAQLLDDANLGLLSDDGRRRLEIGLEVGRRPGELCRLAFDCLAYDERVTENGSTETKPVLVHDMRKVNVVGCRLPVHEHTAELIADQQAAVRARFPDTPSAELVLFPAIQRPKGGRRPIASTGWAKELRRWVNRLELFEGRLGPDGSLHLLRDSNGALVRFDPARVFPYALRHSYAQRHVNAGTPVEVLKELMGHDCLNTTSAYYRITADRKRRAIKTVMPFQMTVSGVRLALVGEPNDSDLGRYVLSETSVPMGSCVEPSNVRANGAACDFRYRCFGCAHFRTDPSYLPELRAYLSKLLATRERLVAALPDLADWRPSRRHPGQRRDRHRPPSNHRLRTRPRPARPPDRATVTEAIELLRKGRAEMDTTFPVQFRGMVAQPAPAVFPAVAAETGRSR